MSLEVYNQTMSSLLKQQRALTKLRKELEGREGRKCWECKQFSHLAKNCRNKGGRVKEKKKLTNRFKALTNRVMQCGVREVRRQEVMREEAKMLWIWREGTQEVGVSEYEEEKTRGGGATAECVGKGKRT